MTRGTERSPYLLRAGLVRNVRTGQHLTTFVVSAVSTILVTRLFLRLLGYPEIGGKGLHIAHVLPGGLLMLASIVLLLGFVGPVIRPAAALVGGIGFGLFIDEVGKFVTADNDYFYRPAAAIMYVAFVLLVLGVQFLSNRRPFDPREHLANAVDHAVEGVAGGLSRRQLALASEQMRAAGRQVPGYAEARALLAGVPRDEVELAAPVDALWSALRRGFNRLARHPAAPRITVVVLVVQAVGAPLIAAAIRLGRGSGLISLPVLGVFVGSALSAMFTARGWLRLRRGDRPRAVRLFELSVLSSLLVTQVFQFAGTQFAAVGGMLLDLTLLGLLGAEQDRLQQAAESRPLPPPPAAPPAPASGSPSPATG